MQLIDCPRGWYSAIYEGNTGSPEIANTLARSHQFPLALLRNIEFDGHIVEGHDWQPFWGAIEAADLSPGDKINLLATPRSYPKGDLPKMPRANINSDRVWFSEYPINWSVGLSQICWVQKAPNKSETPVFSPPETAEEAAIFLSCRLKIAEDRRLEEISDWGIRITQWSSGFYCATLKLIEIGYASLAPWSIDDPDFGGIFTDLENHFRSRSISQIADIAALCNLGSAASEYRVGGSQYKICKVDK
jgi:hypothetical protein